MYTRKPTAWPESSTCARPYHPGSGSHDQLFRLGSKGPLKTALTAQRSNGYAMLMSPKKGETAVHGCHYPVDIAVRMLEVLTRPKVNVTCSF